MGPDINKLLQMIKNLPDIPEEQKQILINNIVKNNRCVQMDTLAKYEILDRGTLTANGTILNVNAPTEIDLGQLAKIEIQFQNTGTIDMMAKMMPDTRRIFLADGDALNLSV